MRKNPKILLQTAALFSVLMFTACAPKQTETIFIISTNDVHGAIDKVPNLATLVNEYRAQDTATVILVDAGDRWTGNPYVDMAPEPGKPIIELMNELGYDLAAYGNHEFDKGLAHLQKRNEDADFDIILANIDTGDTALEQPEPYEIITTKGGNRIAFLGLITNFINGHPDGKDEIFEGTTFPSPYETAKEYSRLKRQSDVLVGLTHIGDDADSVLAVTVPMFNLIIGGHTHTVIDTPRMYGKTMVTQTGKGLKYAGVTKITMRGNKIESMENNLVRLDTLPADQDYALYLDRYFDNKTLQEPIGVLSEDMDLNGVANLVTDCVREKMDTDFAFYHIGGLRVPGMPAGEVLLADMFAIEPFNSSVYKVRMTLPQIRALIINKYNDTANAKEAHRPDIYPSGMAYTILTDGEDNAVDVMYYFKYLYSNSHKYSVAISDYMYEQYAFDKPEVEEVSEPVTDILSEYFRSNKTVKPDNRPRITVMVR